LATNKTEMQINEPNQRTKIKLIFKSHSVLFKKNKKMSEPLPFIKKKKKEVIHYQKSTSPEMQIEEA